jgi:hypothetical protein
VSDLGNANYNETAASNNVAPPDGWPEGQNPSTMNDCARENMAGLKRFWNRNNSVKTTAGTSTAYVLTYDVAAAAYYNGEEFAFYVNATCGAAPSLNINGLGALNIRKFSGGAWTTLVAGDIVATQALRVAYNSVATTFDIVASPPTTVWQALGTATPSGVTTVDFINISTSINHLDCKFSLKPSASGVVLGLQVYGTGGALDTTTNYYCTINTGANGALSNTPFGSTLPLNASAIDSGNPGFKGDFSAQSIQAAEFTTFNFRTGYQSGAVANTVTGAGTHAVAANITGIRFYIISGGGTFSGRITLLGSSN